MRRAVIGLLGLSLATGLAAGVAGPAAANPGPAPGKGNDIPQTATSDDLPNPLADKQEALREQALRMVLNGQSKVETVNGVEVVKIGEKPAPLSARQQARVRDGQQVETRMVDQYVPLSLESTDRVFVILTEFGNQRHPDFPDKDINPATPGPTVFNGPLHNAIPEPDRTRDNSTIWQKDFSADYFRQTYFGSGEGVESLKTYYEKQSSGRYSLDGQVTDWVKLPYNEARYGRSGDPNQGRAGDDPAVCGGNVCSNTWELVEDGLAAWVEQQEAKGASEAEIAEGLKSFDQQDRYDYDGDGNFREPDGYIDRFQVVHAGGGEADGDPYQGEDAIWAHRWYVNGTSAGRTGPASNPLGGTEVGDTGLWVGDYTIQPENGGLSTIAHEYGHDLGLPDQYDTAASGDNPVNWWTLMAQSRARAAGDVGIGTRVADLGVWDKLKLGWLDYEIAIAGQQRTYEMGPHEYNSDKPQALAVVLPKKQVTAELVEPASGSQQWWSGTGNVVNNTLTREVTLPAEAATLTFQANYDIEKGYDFAFVEVDDGSGFTAIPGSITTVATNNGIDGSTDSRYVPATFDLSAYAGQTIRLRFRYVTDGGTIGNDDEVGNDGLFVDDVAVTAGGTTVFADDVEAAAAGWTAQGFRRVGATVTNEFDHYYLASNRSYVSYDRYLKTGPYNFGFPDRPDWVEFFPYQEGLLVNYWDTSFSNNNTSQHPGQGLVLPVDARPDVIYRLDGQPWRGRVQTYDAPFSLRKADSFTLHAQENGRASYIRGQAGQPLFDDTRSYWRAELPRVGVKTPGVGVTLRVTEQSGTSMTVDLGTSKPLSAADTLASVRR